MNEVFKPLPDTLLDPFLLEQNRVGLISDTFIKTLVNKKLDEIDMHNFAALILNRRAKKRNCVVKTVSIDEIFQ